MAIVQDAPCPLRWGDWEAKPNAVGHHYYVNRKTQAAVVDKPPGWGWAAEWDDESRSWVYVHTGTHEAQKSLPEGVLPSHCYVHKRSKHIPHPLVWKQWVAILSKRTNHWYYHDRETMSSTWYRPEGWGTFPEPASETQGTQESPAPLTARGHSIPPETLVLRGITASGRPDEAAVMSQWLRTEGEKAAFLVDSGDFGRPVSKDGVLKAWKAVSNSQAHDIFSAWHNNVSVGHIEVLWYNVDEAEAWCHWSGVSRYAMLAYVYVLPYFRKRKLGTVMVVRACQRAFDNRAKKVVLLLQESNSPLIRFYQRIGFVICEQRFYREEETLLMLELTERPELSEWS